MHQFIRFIGVGFFILIGVLDFSGESFAQANTEMKSTLPAGPIQLDVKIYSRTMVDPALAKLLFNTMLNVGTKESQEAFLTQFAQDTKTQFIKSVSITPRPEVLTALNKLLVQEGERFTDEQRIEIRSGLQLQVRNATALSFSEGLTEILAEYGLTPNDVQGVLRHISPQLLEAVNSPQVSNEQLWWNKNVISKIKKDLEDTDQEIKKIDSAIKQAQDIGFLELYRWSRIQEKLNSWEKLRKQRRALKQKKSNQEYELEQSSSYLSRYIAIKTAEMNKLLRFKQRVAGGNEAAKSEVERIALDIKRAKAVLQDQFNATQEAYGFLADVSMSTAEVARTFSQISEEMQIEGTRKELSKASSLKFLAALQVISRKTSDRVIAKNVSRYFVTGNLNPHTRVEDLVVVQRPEIGEPVLLEPGRLNKPIASLDEITKIILGSNYSDIVFRSILQAGRQIGGSHQQAIAMYKYILSLNEFHKKESVEIEALKRQGKKAEQIDMKKIELLDKLIAKHSKEYKEFYKNTPGYEDFVELAISNIISGMTHGFRSLSKESYEKLWRVLGKEPQYGENQRTQLIEAIVQVLGGKLETKAKTAHVQAQALPIDVLPIPRDVVRESLQMTFDVLVTPSKEMKDAIAKFSYEARGSQTQLNQFRIDLKGQEVLKLVANLEPGLIDRFVSGDKIKSINTAMADDFQKIVDEYWLEKEATKKSEVSVDIRRARASSARQSGDQSFTGERRTTLKTFIAEWTRYILLKKQEMFDKEAYNAMIRQSVKEGKRVESNVEIADIKDSVSYENATDISKKTFLQNANRRENGYLDDVSVKHKEEFHRLLDEKMKEIFDTSKISADLKAELGAVLQSRESVMALAGISIGISEALIGKRMGHLIGVEKPQIRLTAQNEQFGGGLMHVTFQDIRDNKKGVKYSVVDENGDVKTVKEPSLADLEKSRLESERKRNRLLHEQNRKSIVNKEAQIIANQLKIDELQLQIKSQTTPSISLVTQFNTLGVQQRKLQAEVNAYKGIQQLMSPQPESQFKKCVVGLLEVLDKNISRMKKRSEAKNMSYKGMSQGY